MAKKLTIALAGNPNSGKTTIFNNLTGARQHVGNWPGVTVEKKEGICRYNDYEIRVVDLPGTYSLTAYSLDELIARNFVVEERPDVVVDIVDASNLERNLYLTTQFMELGVKLVIALNMIDLAKAKGFKIDAKQLSEFLGAPVIPTVGHKNKGTDELIKAIVDMGNGNLNMRKVTVGYGEEVEEELKKIEELIERDEGVTQRYPSRWLALKLLEGDEEVIKKVRGKIRGTDRLEQVRKSSEHLKGIFGDDVESIIADRRYGFISGIYKRVVSKPAIERRTISDKIDSIVLHRVLGIPIFLFLMWLMFKFTFTFSETPMAWIEALQEWLGNAVSGLFAEEGVLQSLVVDGIIGGVGSVIIFVPIIFLLFLCIAILEDSGYMARAAFVMDRFMYKIGLHGRSFIPMILGFGCNIPGIMATRSIENKRDRFVTILVNPFMSCGARLPVYALLIGCFFPQKASTMLYIIYLIGIVMAIVMAKIFRRYLFPGPAAPFVMELPPYRVPTLKGVIIHMWERGVIFLKKAGTIIFASCILIWFLSSFPRNPEYSRDYDALIQKAESQWVVTQLENERAFEKLEKSYAGGLGRIIEPIVRPLGFDWKIGVGLVGGFLAKEIVVGTLGTLYAVGEGDEESEALREKIKRNYTPLVAFSLMIFTLLYIPCCASIGVIYRETNSWKWALFAAGYTTAIAWIMAFMVYQGGRLIGLG
ncbi:MAG TPA: ferrous iron transport protein B [Syntrophaceae bacterium]|nr:ferrous iron transport protein B [Syntrophaceae bacterium]